MKFFFLFVCVVASSGAGSESCVCILSSASNMPSKLLHLREFSCDSLKSMLSLLSDSLSGRLYKVLTGEFCFDVLLMSVS